MTWMTVLLLMVAMPVKNSCKNRKNNTFFVKYDLEKSLEKDYCMYNNL